MRGTKFGSRKLILLLAFLFIDSYSVLNIKLAYTLFNSDNNKDSESSIHIAFTPKQTLWLVDEVTGQCLGSQGSFGECGDLSLWIWNSKDDDVLLQSAINSEDSMNQLDHAECLGRKRSITNTHELMLHPCSISQFSRTRWTYDYSSGMLSSNSIYSKTFGASCVYNDPKYIVRSCKNGFTPLKRVLFEDRSAYYVSKKNNAQHNNKIKPIRDEVLNTQLIDVGTWKCPITGLIFPRNLDVHLSHVEPDLLSYVTSSSSSSIASSSATINNDTSFVLNSSTTVSNIDISKRQVFMGSGILSKVFMTMTFHIFSMAWYVEASAAQNDSTLAMYSKYSLDELLACEDFFEQLSTTGAYDRTLFVKLAMTLKTKLLLQGFLDEIVLEPKNKAIISAASDEYTEPECQKGLDILFTWRKRSSSLTTLHTIVTDYLEVRIGKMYWELHEPGLANDFMRQFFSLNPVSIDAKKGFITLFPLLFNTKPYYKPTTTSSIISLFDNTIINHNESIDAVRVMKNAAEHIHDKSVSLLIDTYHWQKHLNSLIDKKRPNSAIEENFAAIIVCLYCCLLILSLLSIPTNNINYYYTLKSLSTIVNNHPNMMMKLSNKKRNTSSSNLLQQIGLYTNKQSLIELKANYETSLKSYNNRIYYKKCSPLLKKSTSAPAIHLQQLTKII